ncbi:MAG: type I polyketide synthase, partial [Myxococcota bacterium]
MTDRAKELLRQSLQEVQRLRAALQKAESAANEPIAVVSMACRTPGHVVDPEGFAALLDEGRDAITPFPERWDTDTIFDADPEATGKTYTRHGGFLDDIDRFDATFFGIAGREARAMDPQQRLVLEVAWEALERGGFRPKNLRETPTGVFVGSMGSDYGEAPLDDLDGYRLTGRAASVLSGRLAYILGLQGPTMTVDTACSSSLVSIHLACAALRQGECNLALAGGVQTMSTPALFIEFSRLRGLAVDGRCKSFSHGADGVGWAEGCGVLVLKRLTDAQRDHDDIIALIRGSAVNQDGPSQGLTAPNGPSQQRVIRRALKASRLTPNDIDAIEAHGTGTSLGDPIEAGALTEVFGATGQRSTPLWLGSSKSNIGHTCAAAGVLGMIKMILALEHERLPKTLHCDTPSSHINWKDSPLTLLKDAQSWPRNETRIRRAGVSSFGISGTNAHIVLEERPRAPAKPSVTTVSGPLLISARSDEALQQQAGRWAHWLESHPMTPWSDVVGTAAFHREHFEARAVVHGDRQDTLAALRAMAEGRASKGVAHRAAGEPGPVVFVCGGHGSQWPHMGRELFDASDAFRKTIEACDAALAPHVGWSVQSVLRGIDGSDVPPIDRVDVVQPALFAMSLGLAAAWKAWGIRPDAVVGHSVGEIAAAVIAGALSLADGARIVALRGRLIRRVAQGGGMLHIAQPANDVAPRLEAHARKLSIAVINTPSSAVVSGCLGALETLEQALVADGVQSRRVNIAFAAHSPFMDPIVDELREALEDLTPRPTEIPLYSSLSGAVVQGEHLDAAYWCRNVRDPVRFGETAAALAHDDFGVFIELGGHPVLSEPLQHAVKHRPETVVVASARRNRGGLDALHT